MPRRNGTGPAGLGSMTGWGRGYCRVSRYPRRSIGYGYDQGRWYYPNLEEEKNLLKNEKNYLKARLEEIEEILDEFEEE